MNKPPSIPDYRGYFKYVVFNSNYKYIFYCEEDNSEVFSGKSEIINKYTKYHYIKQIKGVCMISMHTTSQKHGNKMYRCISKEFIKDGKPYPKDGIYSVQYYATRTSVNSVYMECDIPHTMVFMEFDKYGLLTGETYIKTENFVNNGMTVKNNKYGPATVKYRSRKHDEQPRLENYTFCQNGFIKSYTYQLVLKQYAKQIDRPTNESEYNLIQKDRWWDILDKHDYEVFHLTHNLWDQ